MSDCDDKHATSSLVDRGDVILSSTPEVTSVGATRTPTTTADLKLHICVNAGPVTVTSYGSSQTTTPVTNRRIELATPTRTPVSVVRTLG